MAAFLHLLKADASPLAGPAIAAHRREPGARVTVVVLDGPAPDLGPGVAVRRLAAGDLDYAGLLDLIFAADHVVAW